PVFANLVLADEINRAPAKVQSALLEAMQERQVTIGRETHQLPDPFLVMATQNPIESDGTYPLPEAQVDRFMLKVLVDYPSATEEFVIVERMIDVVDDVQSVMGPGELAADVLAVAPDVLRHRLVLSYEALAEDVTADDILGTVLGSIPAPEVAPREGRGPSSDDRTWAPRPR